MEIHYFGSSIKEADWLEAMMEYFRERYTIVSSGRLIVTKGREEDVLIYPDCSYVIDDIIADAGSEPIDMQQSPVKIRKKYLRMEINKNTGQRRRRIINRNFTIYMTNKMLH